LLEVAADYVDAINRRDLGGGSSSAGPSSSATAATPTPTTTRRNLSSLLDEAATHHDDGMFQVRPIKGRSAVRTHWRDWLRAVPDYRLECVRAAASPSSGDVFLLWRGQGVGRLPTPNLHQRPTTNLPFETYGATRLRVDVPGSGRVTDVWSWRSPTADEAEWLLARSARSFPEEDAAGSSLWLPNTPLHGGGGGVGSALGGSGGRGGGGGSSGSSSSSGGLSSSSSARLDREAVVSAARTFRRAFGAVSARDRDLDALRRVLSDDYACREATGVWRENDLRGPEATVEACARRGREAAGTPFWQAEAVSSDGRVMFLHYQNVMTARKTRMVLGVSSGIAVHVFDGSGEGGGAGSPAAATAATAPPPTTTAAAATSSTVRLRRTLLFRGPASMAERAEGFTMDASAAGAAAAARRAFSLSKGATTLGAALATYSAGGPAAAVPVAAAAAL
jgi:hypothetical protein